MKKTILITAGTLIILTVILVWGYMFLYGTPKSTEEVFARFGFTGATNTPVVVQETKPISDTPETNTNTVTSKKLKQLTTRPVAGAVFTPNGIHYVEQGTGHVYAINLRTGAETLISATTIQGTTEAVFSPDGEYVAITSNTSSLRSTIVGKIDSGSEGGKIEGVSLPPGAKEISFSSGTGTLMYLLEETNGASGYSYNVVKGSGTQIFKILLRDVHVIWGDPLYVYTTPSASQIGYIYKVSKSDLDYVTTGKVGLMGISYDDGIITTEISDNVVVSHSQSDFGSVADMPIPLIPEKCTQNSDTPHSLFCTVPTNLEIGVFPDDWYKGVISYSDVLWKINTKDQSATVLSNFLSESGREVDVSKIGTNDSGTYLYFINKNDNTLWMFDTTL